LFNEIPYVPVLAPHHEDVLVVVVVVGGGEIKIHTLLASALGRRVW